jgi:hypothetical protein
VTKAAFATLLALALAIRLLLIATSFGSTDALLLMGYAHLAERFGIGLAYRFAPWNHPPLSGVIMVAADRLGNRIGLEFPDVFRLFQVLADLCSAAILYRLSRSREVVAFFFASPAAIFLSGFHCNADPTMIALLLASVWLSSGALLGASTGIKIAPLPLVPFFLIDLSWRRRLIFLLAWAIVIAVIFIPTVITSGPTVLHNVFGYGGTGSEWGFRGIGFLLRNLAWAQSYERIGKYTVIGAIVLLFIFFWRYRTPLPTMVGTALLTMIFFSPAFGVQYLVWPVPFLLFALSRKLAYTLNAAISLFTFATYTIWAREFPWWFADATAPNPHHTLIAVLAFPLWILYGIAIIAAIVKAKRATPIRNESG